MNTKFLKIVIAILVVATVTVPMTANAQGTAINCKILIDGKVIEVPPGTLNSATGQVCQPDGTWPPPVATPVPAVAPDPEKTATTTTATVTPPAVWSLREIAPYYTLVEVKGEKFMLIEGTTMAVTTANGRYEAVTPKPASKELGWCKPGQPVCPPHLFLIQVSANSPDLTAEMDISYRVILVNQGTQPVQSKIKLVFNDQTRKPGDLIKDYASMSKNGDLGVFFTVQNPMMAAASLRYKEEENAIGFSCWDCLADTQGNTAEKPLRLDDPSMKRVGPDSPVKANSLLPGRVLSVPHPDKEASWSMDALITIQPGTTVVAWVGVYNQNLK